MFDVIVTAQVLQQHKLRTSFQHVNIPGQAIAVWHASKTYRLAYPEAYAVKRQFISQTYFTDSCLEQASANATKAFLTVAVSAPAFSKETSGCCCRSNVRNMPELSQPDGP